MPSSSRLSTSHFTEEKRVQTLTSNAQLGSKEYLMRRRERPAPAQVPTRSSKSGIARKSLRHRKRRNDVKPSQPIPGFIPPSSSISMPSTPAFMPRERMSPPPAPRASRTRVVDLGTPTPPPRSSPRDGPLTAGLLFHGKGSSTVTVKPVEDMTDDESDAWYENMRDPFKGISWIRRVKPNQEF